MTCKLLQSVNSQFREYNQLIIFIFWSLHTAEVLSNLKNTHEGKFFAKKFTDKAFISLTASEYSCLLLGKCA